MANEEQLARLRADGVPAWNAWRRSEACDIDLSGSSLFGALANPKRQIGWRRRHEHFLRALTIKRPLWSLRVPLGRPPLRTLRTDAAGFSPTA
jgi:hypothetical protein